MTVAPIAAVTTAMAAAAAAVDELPLVMAALLSRRRASSHGLGWHRECQRRRRGPGASADLPQVVQRSHWPLPTSV
eukprot:227705-Pyramimonas_sp.AAC.1